jgi:N-glycosylase/DNA lyase
MHVDEAARTFTITVPVDGTSPRTLHVSQGRQGYGVVRIQERPPSPRQTAELLRMVRWILCLDEDLSGFYARIRRDAALAWATRGAGRMVRSPSVFEDVVKTICTTNCAWSATERMVGALVEHLGERASDAPRTGWQGRAFPTPDAMAGARPAFYRHTVRAGYRGAYLRSLARSVADGEFDLEALGRATPAEISDDDVEQRLLALPGVGPYAAAHIMLMIGRYSRPILDSWTRPKYARLVRRRTVSDAAIVRRFRRYGAYAGLAHWLFLTRDWV